jgi:hypothetical protein
MLQGDPKFAGPGHAHQLGLVEYRDADGHARVLDVLRMVLGVADPASRARPVEYDVNGGSVSLMVMHPLDVLKSRVANIYSLHRTDDHTIGQARVSVVCLREFLREASSQGAAKHVLKCYQEIFRFACNPQSQRLHREYGIEVFDAVALHPELPTAFASANYPHMLAKIAKKRHPAS